MSDEHTHLPLIVAVGGDERLVQCLEVEGIDAYAFIDGSV
jgi:hypothetical protein